MLVTFAALAIGNDAKASCARRRAPPGAPGVREWLTGIGRPRADPIQADHCRIIVELGKIAVGEQLVDDPTDHSPYLQARCRSQQLW